MPKSSPKLFGTSEQSKGQHVKSAPRRPKLMSGRSGRSLVPLLALALLVVGLDTRAQSATDDDVVASFKPIYRTVGGGSWAEVSRSIQRNLIALSGTERYEAVTNYAVDVLPTNVTCTPANTKLRLKLTMSVPQLDRRSALTGDDLACWANYDRTLEDHEEGHVSIAEHDARELLSEIRAAPGASCGDIKRMVSLRRAALQATQDEYDRVSAHGITQWRAWQLDKPADAKGQRLSEKCAAMAAARRNPIVFDK